MGNSVAAGIIRLFDRRHLEIDSISGKIDRDRSRGCYEKHEIFVENDEMFRYRNRQNSTNQVKKIFSLGNGWNLISWKYAQSMSLKIQFELLPIQKRSKVKWKTNKSNMQCNVFLSYTVNDTEEVNESIEFSLFLTVTNSFNPVMCPTFCSTTFSIKCCACMHWFAFDHP